MSSVLISNRVNIIKYNTYKHKFSGVPNKFKGIRCPETKASEDRCDREQRQGMARGHGKDLRSPSCIISKFQLTFLKYFLEPQSPVVLFIVRGKKSLGGTLDTGLTPRGAVSFSTSQAPPGLPSPLGSGYTPPLVTVHLARRLDKIITVTSFLIQQSLCKCIVLLSFQQTQRDLCRPTAFGPVDEARLKR